MFSTLLTCLQVHRPFMHLLSFPWRECSPSAGLFVIELQTFVFISAISIPWIIAAIFTFFTDANFNFTTSDTVIYLLVLLPVTPLLVMCVAYYVIRRKQKSLICNHNNVNRSFRFHLASIPDF